MNTPVNSVPNHFLTDFANTPEVDENTVHNYLPAQPTRLVVADGHPVTIKGIENILSSEPTLELVETSTNAEDTLVALLQHQPELLLLDIDLPGRDPLSLLSDIAHNFPRVKTILFAVSIDDNQISKAIQLGVRGMLLKSAQPPLITQCLRRIQSGGQWLERKAVQSALEKILRRQLEIEKISQTLTPRELEVAILVAKGLSNKIVSQEIHISEGSIKTYLYRIYAKLNIKNRVELTLNLQERDLL